MPKSKILNLLSNATSDAWNLTTKNAPPLAGAFVGSTYGFVDAIYRSSDEFAHGVIKATAISTASCLSSIALTTALMASYMAVLRCNRSGESYGNDVVVRADGTPVRKYDTILIIAATGLTLAMGSPGAFIVDEIATKYFGARSLYAVRPIQSEHESLRAKRPTLQTFTLNHDQFAYVIR